MTKLHCSYRVKPRKRGAESLCDFQIMGSKRTLLWPHIIHQMGPNKRPPSVEQLEFLLDRRGTCVHPSSTQNPAFWKQMFSIPSRPRPSLRLPCSFFIITGQQIKTEWESAFVVETTESPSDLPTGGLSLAFTLGFCLTVCLPLSLHLQYLGSPSQGGLICAENKKPGKTWAGVGLIIDYLTIGTSLVYIESIVLSLVIDLDSNTSHLNYLCVGVFSCRVLFIMITFLNVDTRLI